MTERQATNVKTNVISEMKGKAGGPKLGEKPIGGFRIDKSNDATLREMIKEVVPQFKQLTFNDDVTGKSIKYNLYSPTNAEHDKKYPLVLFIADATTPGDDISLSLTQGYGGLIWATEDWQKEHPCFVLVPQFSGVTVNDAYQHTDEVDAIIRLLRYVYDKEAVDTSRLYIIGQSLGGMISMYYNVAYPDIFAASIFVDSHWDKETFPELVKHKFVWFIAGNEGKAYPQIEFLEKTAQQEGIKYAFAKWSAKLLETEQNTLANEMFAKGEDVNLIEFAPKSVLPAGGKGSEHMMSFDYAYKISAVRERIFN